MSWESWNAEVDEVLTGSPVKSTRAERQVATAILTRKGLSARLIAERLCITERTVHRLRTRDSFTTR